MSARSDLNAFLKIASDKVRNNTQVVEASQMPLPFMLHLTPDLSNKEYVPRIGHNQGRTEDRTMPRITVADTLVGCMIGYAAIENDFLNRSADKQLSSISKNGYRINRLDYKFCLKPNAKLVYDAPATNEHWLIAYDKETKVYKPQLAGYLVIASITVVQHPKYDEPDSIITAFVDVREKDGIYLAEGVLLQRGYHSFTIRYNRHVAFDMKLGSDFSTKQISKSEFTNRKMLESSVEAEPTAFMKW